MKFDNGMDKYLFRSTTFGEVRLFKGGQYVIIERCKVKRRGKVRSLREAIVLIRGY
jgi:hypothetical protein